MKKILALICTFAMLMCLVSGCSSKTEEPVQSEQPAQSPAVEQEEAAEMERPEEETAEEVFDEAAEEEPILISYPFEERKSFTVYCPQDSMTTMLLSKMGKEPVWYSMPTLEYLQETINFEFEFVSPGETAATEQFNLMVASDEMTDMFEGSLYSGGTTQAYNDGVIADLTDLMAANMPDYWALVQEQEPIQIANLISDDGKIYSINDITENNSATQGLLIRQDMLEGVGLTAPVTVAQLKEALVAVHEQYGTEQTFYLDPDGNMGNVVGAFGSAGFDVTGSTSDPGFYVSDGQVQAALLSDGYYDYLQYFIELYNEGVIYKDFYTQVRSASLMNSLSLGRAFIWNGDGGLIDSMTATGKKEVPEYQLGGLGAIVMNEGDAYHFAAAVNIIDTKGTCISSSCEDVEGAMQLINWFFTEEGRHYCLWGVEGETFNYDEGGKEAFTEAVTDGVFNITLMYDFYMWSPCAKYIERANLQEHYSDLVISAYDQWGKADSANTLPASITLTTEESEQYTNLIPDICTYAGECILKWITGEEKLTKEAWASLSADLEGMGINDCVSIYQAAYERCISRVQ
ncbi:MAG: extracellular solute-binding protein [Ruminococcaceae bacterium]|nr:extracellular solute-binding protein [Oscillospiraceae bacterium]